MAISLAFTIAFFSKGGNWRIGGIVAGVFVLVILGYLIFGLVFSDKRKKTYEKQDIQVATLVDLNKTDIYKRRPLSLEIMQYTRNTARENDIHNPEFFEDRENIPTRDPAKRMRITLEIFVVIFIFIACMIVIQNF